MAAPASVPDWMRPPGLPDRRLPSAQALQRLVAGNVRHQRQRTGEHLPPGDELAASFPFALVVGCMEADAAGEHLFAERPGSVQCVRSAGPSLGDDTMAAIEYAALVQNVSLVLVLTHRGCGVLRAAANARAAGDLPLPGELRGWVPRAASGTGLGEPATGHVRTLRASLRATDSLLTLLHYGQLKIAGGVLDPATGAIAFLPDEPDEVADDAPSARFGVRRGS